MKSRLQRIRRVLGFASARIGALRQDHAAFWLLAGPHAPRADEPTAARIEAFKRKLELANRLVEQGHKLLAELDRLSPAAAVAASGRFDPEQLATAVRELDALVAGVAAARQTFDAHALTRPAAAPPPPDPRGTAELKPAARAAEGPVAGWFRRLTQPLTPERAVPPPPPQTPVSAYLAQLAGAVETAGQVLAEIESELTILKASLEGTALPVPRRPWPDVPEALEVIAKRYTLDPVQTSWLMPVSKRLYSDNEAVRRAHVAVTQWDDTTTMLKDAALRQKVLPSSAPARQVALMGSFHPGKLRAAVLPLTHLHLTFAPVPVLNRLFPAPEAE